VASVSALINLHNPEKKRSRLPRRATLKQPQV
jgi:hypothetical protein